MNYYILLRYLLGGFFVSGVSFGGANEVIETQIVQDEVPDLMKGFLFKEGDREAVGKIYSKTDHNKDYPYTVFLENKNSSEKIINSFNQDIKKNNQVGEISICRRVISIRSGYKNRNASYGGVCLLKDHAEIEIIQICNDEMVGHFKTEQIDSDIDQFDGSILFLSDFVMKNCFGG